MMSCRTAAVLFSSSIAVLAGSLGGGVRRVEAALENHLSIPTSSCRWNPVDDSELWTHSQSNKYWISAYSIIDVYCPVPSYFGTNTSSHIWGVYATNLSAGEISVSATGPTPVSAQIIQYSDSATYSICASVSGSGILLPPPCALTHHNMVVSTRLPSGGSFFGVMVDDYN